MTLAIIDSGGANISSVTHALKRLGATAVFTADAAVIRSAERVILPGVGAAGSAMSHLRKLGLCECIRELRQPVLGICLGMQLLYEHSNEDQVDCLGIIPGTLQRLSPQAGLRVPHMGWNTSQSVAARADDPLLRGLPADAWFYFLHSFYAPTSTHTLATCIHGDSFSAIVRKDNFYGVQFHPERSAQSGAKLLANFLTCN